MAPSDITSALLLRASLHAVAAVACAVALASAASASPGASGGPTSLAHPTVAGMPTEGARLRGSAGKWAGSGRVRLAYQWYRCDTMGGR